MLGASVTHMAGSGVPVFPLTRIGPNVALSIIQATIEARISTIVLGWSGKPTIQERVFGRIIDHVLAETCTLALVTRLTRAPNTARRIVLVLPPNAEKSPGFPAALRTCGKLASNLSKGLVVRPAEPPSDAVARAVHAVAPDLVVTFEPLPGWADVPGALQAQVGPDDLLVLMSARRGSLPWHSALEQLPGILAANPARSFIVLDPPEPGVPTPPESPPGHALPARLDPAFD